MIANALAIEARTEQGRTIVSRIRTSGLLRTSRPFREGAAARIVVAHLGPGMVRGDAFAIGGRVAPGAHLIVAGQMATRVLSGPERVTNEATWTLERDATLELIAEPTLVSSGAAYDARLELALAPGARAVVVELIRRDRGSALSIATIARRGARHALIDVLRFDADEGGDEVFGTLAIFGNADVDALDREADACHGVRIGIGVLRDGDVLARVTGARVFDVHSALERLRTIALAALG
jgi:hypothetical protein